jgi:hypothetical protein
MLNDTYKNLVFDLSNQFQYISEIYLLRAILGLVTEYAEFLAEPSLDELGDCLFWYTAIKLCHSTKFVIGDGDFDSIKLMEAGEKLTRVGKQKLSDEKQTKMNRQLDTQLSLFYNKVILNYLEQNNFSISDLQTQNMVKLTGRYEITS